MEPLLYSTNWEEIAFDDLKAGMYIQCTKTKYGKRNCNYLVIHQTIESEGNPKDVWVNGYNLPGHRKKDFPSWKLRPTCKYRNEKYYINKNCMYERDIHVVKAIRAIRRRARKIHSKNRVSSMTS